MSTVLIVDDDPAVLRVLKGLLEGAGLLTLAASDTAEAAPFIERAEPDLIITDLRMPGGSGMDVLALARKASPSVPVIMITAHGEVETAVEAMKKGAYDFISKPFDEDELLASVKKALSESEGNEGLLSDYFEAERLFLPEVIGASPAMKGVMETVKKVAPSDSTVLISGETGVGKELVARAVHEASPRRRHPFVKINCAAIPETLMESELFGHEKGAFTGAATGKPGRFEIADRGTVFLDEVGETPYSAQVKLLNVLQDRCFERVGGVKNIRVDVRVVAATNRDLPEAVRSGKFRADLFYRLNVIPVAIPPLRERKEDLIPLSEHFLEKFSARYRKRKCRLSAEALSALGLYDWPGNIRELENVLERMVLLHDSEVLGLEHLPVEIRGADTGKQASGLLEKKNALSRVAEKQMIAEALEKTGQNRTRAATVLGISRRALQNKIREYGL